ncbi:MAG: DUF721 domain-containing protein [Deltaproteobacteria bacterium]|nr:DUF721 domain-containing protein [Deltaproteobacteria bacterium]
MVFRGRRQPKQIGDILDSALQHGLRHTGIGARRNDFDVFRNWKAIVGEEVAGVTEPEKLQRRTTLVVRVFDSAWLQELALQKEALLEKIRVASPDSTINELRFLSGDPRKAMRQNQEEPKR